MTLVSTRVEGKAFANGAYSRPVGVTMYFDSHAPLEVVIDFEQGDDHSVEWTVGRDLLIAGSLAWLPVGQGDFKVQRVSMDVVVFSLSSPEGEAKVAITHKPFRDFLNDTMKVSPAGKEDLDRELDEFLQEVLGE